MIQYLLIAVAVLSCFMREKTRYLALASLFLLSFLQMTLVQFVFVFISAAALLLWKEPKPEDVSLSIFLLAGAVGVISAKDIFVLFIFFELSLVASYFLVFERSKRDLDALSHYLYLSSIGTSFVVLSIALIWAENGSLDFSVLSTSPLALIFLIVGFGVKMGIFPFHMWVMRVYPTSPVPVVILLSAVLSKVGAAGFMRLFPLFAFDPAMVIVLALLSMSVANISAISERDTKKILAYSSIANLSYIMLAIGMGAARAATLHIVTHSISITCAFATVGLLAQRFGTSDLRKLRGTASSNRLLAFATAVSLFSIAGLPFLPVFISEFYILSSIITSPLVAAAFVSNVLIGGFSIANLARVLEFGRPKKDVRLSRTEAAVLVALVAIIIMTGLMPSLLLDRI